MRKLRLASRAAPLIRLLLACVVVGVLSVLLCCASADALGVRVPHTTIAGHPMPPNGQEDEKAVGELKPVSPSDLESNEIWRNRPRVIPRESDGALKLAEQRVCRLPNGGVSAGVLEQLQRNRAQREAERREKEERERKAEEQQREQNKEL